MSSSKQDQESFAITTSLLYHPSLFPTDCPFFHLPLHILRLLRAATYFQTSLNPDHSPGQWDSVINYLSESPPPLLVPLLERVKAQETVTPAKVRISIHPPASGEPVVPSIDFDIYIPEIPHRQLFPEIPLPPPPSTGAPSEKSAFLAVLDTEPTEWKDEMAFKTTWRKQYSAARERCVRGHFKEVIMYDRQGEVIEGSVTNVFFYRDGEWIGMKKGLDGTIRRWMREKKLVRDHVGLKVDEIKKEGEWILISNGVRGTWFAWLVAPRKD